MSRFLTGRAAALPPYAPAEAEDRLIALNLNESPFPPAPGVAGAVAEAVTGLNRYNDPDCNALREAIGALNGLEPDMVMAGNGSDQVLYLAFMAFAGDRPLLMPDVTYSYYDDFAAALGITVHRKALREDFTADPRDYKSDGVPVIANPNAPTGLALGLEDIREILEADPGRVVIVDEAYYGFGAETAAELIPEYPNLLITRTFSKYAGLAGARLGYALGQKDLIAELGSVRSAVDLYGVSAMAQAAGIAACREWDYYRANAEEIIRSREWTAERLRETGFGVLPSLTNFLFVTADVPASRMAARLKEKGVLVRCWNRPRLENRLRISVGTADEMAVLVTAMKEIMEESL